MTRQPESTIGDTGFLSDLIEINHEITAILDLDPLLRKIAEITARIVPYEVFAILLIDGAELYYRFAIGHAPEVVRTLRVPVGQGIIGTAAAQRRTMVVDDVSTESHYINVVSNTRSELAVPLISKDRVIGVLDIESPQLAYFQEDQVRVLNLLASQIAIAIANARVYESERRNREILALLYDISLEVASTLDVEELIQKISRSIKGAVEHHIFSILLLDEATHKLRPRIVFRHDAEAYEKFDIALGEGLVGSSARDNRPVRVGDVHADPRYIDLHSETRSEMVIPLAFKGRVIGVLDLESREVNHFTEHDERLLMTLATRIASALVNAELYEQVAESEQRFQQELEIARELQRQLLPDEVAPIGPLAIAVSFDPVAHLGGDHYDVLRFDDGRSAIALGDVAGKGAPAALYAALAGGIIRTRATRKYPPAQMLELVNTTLQQRPIASHYIALTYAIYDPSNRQLTLANSGLPYPILVRGDDFSFLELAGIPLGLFPRSTYQERTIELMDEDLLVFYTDGIVERRDPHGEDFGLQRLAQLVLDNRRASPDAVIAAIRDELDRFTGNCPASDDQTMIVMKMGTTG